MSAILPLLAVASLAAGAAVHAHRDGSAAKSVEELEADLVRLRQKLARLGDDPDFVEYVQDMEQRLVEARRAEDSASRFGVEARVHEAWRELDRTFAVQSAEILAAAIRDAGGPNTTRAWSKPGVGARVYFPGEAGYLTVEQDGSVSELSRGRLTFVESAFYPNWKRAVRAGRKAYMQGLDARLDAHGEARAAAAAQIRNAKR